MIFFSFNATPKKSSMPYSPDQITVLLNQMGDGDRNPVEVLYPLIYEHLKEVARGQLRGERRGHTLQTTALVNEAYLKMVGQRQAGFQNRSHFLAIAAIAMRRILVSHARKRSAGKRGGGEAIVTFEDGMAPRDAKASELIDLDEALNRLAEMNAEQARVVEYRFFGGLSYEEIAEVTGSTVHSVRYDWRVARAWLKRELEKETGR
jgi:RNA polymerase sigma factor (TIGR02999 family)